LTKKLEVRKVAFLGSATSSRLFCPFNDPDWEIWATGPGRQADPAFKTEFNRWFELHDMMENDPQYHTVLDPGYFEWLQAIADEKVIYFKPPLYPGLKGELFPWDEIKEKHSGYFLDSTVAWMLAYCYEFYDVDEIGLYGVDFATDSERRKQRKGTKHFAELFRLKGTKVTVPEVSEMAFDPLPYPEESALSKKLHTHLKLLEPQAAEVQQNMEKAKQALAAERERSEYIRGTMEALLHFKENWS